MVLSGPGRAVSHNAGSVIIMVFSHAGSDPGTPKARPGQPVTPVIVHKVTMPVLESRQSPLAQLLLPFPRA